MNQLLEMKIMFILVRQQARCILLKIDTINNFKDPEHIFLLILHDNFQAY